MRQRGKIRGQVWSNQAGRVIESFVRDAEDSTAAFLLQCWDKVAVDEKLAELRGALREWRGLKMIAQFRPDCRGIHCISGVRRWER